MMRSTWRYGRALGRALALAFALVAGAHAAHAQEVTSPTSLERAGVAEVRQTDANAPAWSALRITKWSTAAVSAAAAIYGFGTNQRGDARYEALERACVAEAEVCALRNADGSYQDAELEARYQEVRRLDRRARNALLVSQVGVAVSVVLFVLDLRNARTPDDILYEPKPLEVGPGRDGGVELRLRIPAG